MTKNKKCKHEVNHLSDVCNFCGKTRDEIAEEVYQEEQEKIKAKKQREHERALDRAGDALDGKSIGTWERDHGHGFWGSSANGYIYDKDNR